MLTIEQLLAIAPSARALRLSMFLPHLQEGMAAHAINTFERQAQFLATITHESGGFAHTVEIWGPTPDQRGYEGRAALGNTHPGDGSLFRGRGLIQITGRANYAAASKALGEDYIAHPQYLERTRDAALSACWWWEAHGCNELADVGELSGFDRVTRRVNGGHNGWSDRVAAYERAKAALKPNFSNVQAGSASTAPAP